MKVGDYIPAILLSHRDVGVVLAHREVWRNGDAQRDALLHSLHILFSLEMSKSVLGSIDRDEGERHQAVVVDVEGGVNGHVEGVATTYYHIRVFTVEPAGVVVEASTTEVHAADLCSVIEGKPI